MALSRGRSGRQIGLLGEVARSRTVRVMSPIPTCRIGTPAGKTRADGCKCGETAGGGGSDTALAAQETEGEEDAEKDKPLFDAFSEAMAG